MSTAMPKTTESSVAGWVVSEHVKHYAGLQNRQYEKASKADRQLSLSI